MMIYPTHCPSCSSTKFKSVAEQDSLAPGRKAYRLCLNCGSAYRPHGVPLDALAWAVVLFLGLTLACILGFAFGNLIWGSAGLFGSALVGWAIRRDVSRFRPSTKIGLLPRDGGAASERLREAFKKYDKPHTALFNLARQAFGRSLIGVGGLLFFIGGSVIWHELKPEQLRGFDANSFDFGIMGSLAAAAGSMCGIWLIVFGRKVGARRAYSILPRDHRAPILLLRSFQDDEIPLPKPPAKKSSEFETVFWSLLPSNRAYNTLEHSIVAAFEVIGPVVALGAPNQLVAPSGAARIWFSHADWDRYVEDLAQWAQRIILVVGDFERKGMAWEAEHLLSKVSRRKIVLIMPPNAQPVDNQARWMFLEKLSQGRLPPYRPGTLALYFTQPNRLMRVSLGSPTELIELEREKLSELYENVLVNVRDFADNATQAGFWKQKVEQEGSKGVLVEAFPWTTPDLQVINNVSG